MLRCDRPRRHAGLWQSERTFSTICPLAESNKADKPSKATDICTIAVCPMNRSVPINTGRKAIKRSSSDIVASLPHWPKSYRWLFALLELVPAKSRGTFSAR